MHKNRGITLVALVITIVVLLILAGISISQLINIGIFAKSEEAKKRTENAQVEENMTLADYESRIGKYISGNREEITVDKAEYEQLKARVDELGQKIKNLETKNSKFGYIDVSNNIENFAITKDSNLYTATEDCYLTASLYTYGGSSIGIYVNDVQISAVYNNNSGWVGSPFSISLTEGDTIKFVPSDYNKIMSSINVWKIK